MKSFSSLMGEQKLLPIVQADTVEQGIAIAGAMAKANIHLVEVVLRTPESLAALTAIKKAYPSLIVGAGTVTSPDILKQALMAGADFIVTPAISPKLVEHLAKCSVPVLPGVSNTGDILLASEAGFTELKLFPASLSGGAKFIAAMGSVFSELRFCPTGGVDEKNLDEYLNLSNVFAAGGTWMAKKDWVESKDYDKITQACLV